MKQARLLATAFLTVAITFAGIQTALAGSSSTSREFTGTRTLLNAPGSSASLSSSANAPKRVLVRMKSAPTSTTVADVGRRTNASPRSVAAKSHGRLEWKIPSGRTATEFATELMATGKVEYAVPSYTRKLAYVPPAYASPNDPAFLDSRTMSFSSYGEKYPYAFSWWLRDIHAPQAWAVGYTGSNVTGKYPLRADGATFKIAVLDTGLYATHEDADTNIAQGRDYFDHLDANGMLVTDNDVTPPDPAEMRGVTLSEAQSTASHGTCVAGIAGATVNNAIGAVGVGYDTKVIVHKVCGWNAPGIAEIDDGAIVDAIYGAVDIDHAKVINMSLSGYDYSQPIADAITYAHSMGVIVVAAKGNDATGIPSYPACNTYVVSVGALYKNINAATLPASFSNYSRTSRDIMAPGSFVFGLYKPDVTPLVSLAHQGYDIWDGTSMASPVVAGAIAWLWRAAPALSADEITGVVLNSATRRAARTHYPYGYRTLDMNSAYSALKASYPLLGKPQIVDQTVALVDGELPVSWAVRTSPIRGATYDVDIDDSPRENATSAGSGLMGLGVGDHVMDVTAHSSYNWDDGTATATASVHVLPLAAGDATWSLAHVSGSSALVAVPTYHTYASFEATLRDASSTPLAGASPVVESSTDGVHFSAASGVLLAALPNGAYRVSVLTESTRFYRLRLAPVGLVGGATSNAVIVKPKVYLSTPSSKSTVKRNRSFKVSGTIKPAHGARSVKLQVKRWNGHRWAAYTTVYASIARHGSYSTYSKSLKLKKGSYRLYARAPADALHADTTSGYRSVRAR
jgi:hypothetical protein